MILWYRSLNQPNTNDGPSTNAAHNGEWWTRWAAANRMLVNKLAPLAPATESLATAG